MKSTFEKNLFEEVEDWIASEHPDDFFIQGEAPRVAVEAWADPISIQLPKGFLRNKTLGYTIPVKTTEWKTEWTVYELFGAILLGDSHFSEQIDLMTDQGRRYGEEKLRNWKKYQVPEELITTILNSAQMVYESDVR